MSHFVATVSGNQHGGDGDSEVGLVTPSCPSQKSWDPDKICRFL